MPLESEEGEFLPRFELQMAVIEKDTNSSLSLVSYAKGLHSMDRILMSVQSLFPMDVLLQSVMDRGLSQVLINTDELQLPGEVSDTSNLQMVLCEGEYSDGDKVDAIPLCALPPGHTSSCVVSNWVLKKVEEIQDCVGISCNGFEEHFKALLITFESECSSARKGQIEREGVSPFLMKPKILSWNVRGLNDSSLYSVPGKLILFAFKKQSYV